MTDYEFKCLLTAILVAPSLSFQHKDDSAIADQNNEKANKYRIEQAKQLVDDLL